MKDPWRSMDTILLQSSGMRTGSRRCPKAIDAPIEPFQSCSTQRHDDSTEREESHSTFERHLLEDGIGIPGQSVIIR